ncbi:ORF1 protein [Cacao swollen shoot Ghana N virus]|uniref:ORF1 protein n=1 Tax=Cacao swollen shoot Ghana N virus TaxID=2056884 RepID=A0A2H4U953_9VIRU|nr:ORF1 protein [Cacao swollen shoot Ghana N virus]ATZ69484.1 ORF1 protein [Cacao swollen shoot Ghana N virus]
MSDRWEKSIQEWYEKSHTANLEYLDLAASSKVSTNQLAHNLSVIFDRVSLGNRVQIKNLKQIQESVLDLDRKVSSLESKIQKLAKQFKENKPLSESEVRHLVSEIAKQPKIVEEQALLISQKLEEKLERVESLLLKLDHWVGTE